VKRINVFSLVFQQPASSTSYAHIKKGGIAQEAFIMEMIRFLIDDALKNSNIKPLGSARLSTPVRFCGDGEVIFGRSVALGTIKGPSIMSVSQIVCINGGKVVFGDNVRVNNNFFIIADTVSVIIEEDTVIGANFKALTRNGHRIEHDRRDEIDNPKAIAIRRNVWIGHDCTVLKGTEIGTNSVIGLGVTLSRGVIIEPQSIIKMRNDLEFG